MTTGGSTDIDEHVSLAREARSRAHAPFSRFTVGSVVVTSRGETFAGCNVESASFGLTLCAERSALARWISSREKDERGEIELVVIVTGADRPTPPCGACRQWIAELAPHAKVVAEAKDGARATWTASELLPDAFGGDELPS